MAGIAEPLWPMLLSSLNGRGESPIVHTAKLRHELPNLAELKGLVFAKLLASFSVEDHVRSIGSLVLSESRPALSSAEQRFEISLCSHASQPNSLNAAG